MLNEIHDIAQALEEAKVVLRTTSVLLRPHSRSPVVECWIDSKGGVSKIELKEQCQGPGKIKPNNHASFPAVALSIVPLAGSQPKDLSILRGLVVEGVSSPNLFRKGLEKSIKSYRKALGYLAPDSELERFARSVTAIDLDLWLARIVEELPGCIKDLSEDLLKKVGKHFFPGGGLQLMVVPEYDPDIVFSLSGLQAAIPASDNGVSSSVDMYGGSGNSDGMLSISLPIHPMPVPLVSRPRDFRALHRYGKPALTLSEESIRRFNAALSFLFDSERRQKTWQTISDGSRGSRLVIVSGDPDRGGELLGFLSKHRGMEDAEYELLGEKLLEGDSSVPLSLIFLSSPQRMGVRIEAVQTYSKAEWTEILCSWKRDVRPAECGLLKNLNLPVTPERVRTVLLTAWRSSSGEIEARTLRASNFRPPVEQLYLITPKQARSLIQAVLQNLSQHARLGVADLRYSGLKNNRLRYAIAEIACVLSFGARRAHWKLSPMHPSYQLGKVFALGDALHAAYHREKNDKLPGGALAGSDALASAKHHPNEAFCRLYRRLRPALLWASRIRRGQEGELSRNEIVALGAIKRLKKVFPDSADAPPAFPKDRLEHETMLFLGYQADPFADETSPEGRKPNEY
jgi:hypothetical protein